MTGNRQRWIFMFFLALVSCGVVGILSTAQSRAQSDASGTALVANQPDQVAIQTGPVVMADASHIIVTCRTSIPAELTITAKITEPAQAKELTAASPSGVFHRTQITLPAGAKALTYTVTAKSGKSVTTAGPFSVRVPGSGETFRFIAIGDCRSNPAGWKSVADAVLKEKPDLVLFTGDLVNKGNVEASWDHEFFTPAKELLQSVPVYCVLGNHDVNAPVYFQMFATPRVEGGEDNWSQVIGNTLFVGVDGDKNWGKDSANAKWLDGLLKGSKEKFVFVANHYPAWSSGPHGSRLEHGTAISRNDIMPLLVKYKATALVAGHDHFYERIEPPAASGVTVIVAGGAGAPLYGKVHGGNPWSKAFDSALSYSVFDVSADKCEMKAYSVDGKLIDEKTFKPRE